MRHNWKVLNNTSNKPHNNPDLGAMRFWRVNGLLVRGNVQPTSLHTVMYGVRAEGSCNLSLRGNTYANAEGQSLVFGGC
jgi:hypothetical protein